MGVTPDAHDSFSLEPLPDSLCRIWAKWSKTGKAAPEGGETYHPLICHMLDVAFVARSLWEHALPEATRARLTRHLGLGDQDAARAWVAFFTGLHDIGKASPGFQDQLSDTPAGESIRGWMRLAKLDFTNAEWVAHGAVSARVLGYVLADLGVSEELADQIATLVGGHHGVFPRSGDLDRLKDRHQVGYGTWNTIREELVAALRRGVGAYGLAPRGKFTPADAMVFAGFVSVADWIGSNETYFPHAGQLASAPQPLSLAEYVTRAEKHAMAALQNVRMDAFADRDGELRHRTFGELFPMIAEPRDVQRAVVEVAEHIHGPALVIIEAPMGEGKTEAALYLAETWGATQQRRGAYIALPTQATSNQMFARVTEYLKQWYSDADYVTAHLVYGEASLDDFYQGLLDQGRIVLGAERESPSHTGERALDGGEVISHEEGDAAEGEEDAFPLAGEGPVYDGCGEEATREGTVIAVEWFAAPKRALLAPFGVGTIDQALLAVLQTKHFFVRLFGLAGKTVIVDEVHAYDTYMSTLLDRLLEWLGAFDVPVVLLSATLPQEKRMQLQAAYARYTGWTDARQDTPRVSYPRLTCLTSAGVRSRAVVTSSAMSRPVEVEWLEGAAPDTAEGIAALGERLRAALPEGGCAAVLCNTVGRAQRVYDALRPYFPGTADDGYPELDLFHARFLREDRAEREKRVLCRFGNGKAAKRPHRAVLVATQVIEQSLDLDFDLMISDLAPIDLLLQRSGRLHRHREDNRQRPKAVAVPRLIIPCPEERDGYPRFPQSDEFIYDTHFLLRTWLVLRGRTQIRVPQEIEELIESVYDSTSECPEDTAQAVRAVCEQARRAYERSVGHDRDGARVRLVPPPRDDTVFTGRNLNLKEEDEAPDADETALALTRLGPPSVRVVLLPAQWAEQQLKAKGRPPDRKTTRSLLNHSVPIAHGAVAPVLIQQEPPTHWKRSPWLRHTRLIALDDNGQAIIPTDGKKGEKPRFYVLKLDPALGVIIVRQAEAEPEGSGSSVQ